MMEGPPNQNNKTEEKSQKRREMIALATELSKSRERFAFPGIEAGSYQKLKAVEANFPGYATPIDKLVERFKNEGIKVVLGDDPESGNIHILPAHSDDINNDSVFPRHLQISEGMDGKLKQLILLNKR
ncbi:MAG: hypothetical protein A2408_00960 [Candidatus Yonathbacteria bacterium RIFOXYC1_FULL_52_10]|uniref:Uncharacterized protein n=1 Tax=Candidatus Yonathbacteria bacterium RIFOXYD1_FULL_52_36 TaxID=1802730 RepID=A0A1G2SNH3_9BACT|nr:MAG: hypothetical protein A2408_00960 [Candidatus Yonathbacteria bacterium RIFOXYC1_FULL_52_10]OHA86362.1 MAG: hypothetical protein A2591_02585 [Candidatus Yonathbacteria bacterium RIFOXYD1_FULL_52_36]